jgi:ligand-binding SRPBCC domain-containing protein
MASVSLLRRAQTLPIPLAQAWDFFSDPRNLSVLTPPGLALKVLSIPPPAVYPGLMIRYSVRPLPGFRTTWLTEITQVRAPEFFVDEQRMGPYRLWHHEHRFRPAAGGGVLVEDIVHYALPFGFLGSLFAGALVRRQLNAIFAFRSKVLADRFGTV